MCLTQEVGQGGLLPVRAMMCLTLEVDPFNDNISLPSEWDVSAVNLSPELLAACGQRIKQQRTFDLKPLGVSVCYMCGHVLWTSV